MSARQTITTLSGAPLDGTCKLTADQLKTSTNNTITFPSGGGTLATLAGTETLTNKTLTTPTISSFKNGYNIITVPDKTGTIALTSDINAGGTYPIVESMVISGFDEVSSSDVNSTGIYLKPLLVARYTRIIFFDCAVKFKTNLAAGATKTIQSNSFGSSSYLPSTGCMCPFIDESTKKTLGSVFITPDGARIKLIYTASEAVATTVSTYISGVYFTA